MWEVFLVSCSTDMMKAVASKKKKNCNQKWCFWFKMMWSIIHVINFIIYTVLQRFHLHFLDWPSPILLERYYFWSLSNFIPLILTLQYRIQGLILRARSWFIPFLYWFYDNFLSPIVAMDMYHKCFKVKPLFWNHVCIKVLR